LKLSDLAPALAQNVHFSTSERMKEVQSESIQSVICSPPYWNLKDYGHPEQIGHGERYKKYLQRLDSVWLECKRTLRKDGTIWIVVDKIWHQGDLVMIPFDIVKHCRELGFYLQDVIVWNKPTAIAGMNDRNLVNKFEFVIFMSKSKNEVKILRPAQNGKRSPDFDPNTGRLTNLWRFPVKAGSIRKTPNHKAPYPEELIARLVQISSEEGDSILDPFLGSGTTMKVALAHNRRCIGYEINSEFESMIAERMRNLSPSFLQARLQE
jgi:DNA modification methylase